MHGGGASGIGATRPGSPVDVTSSVTPTTVVPSISVGTKKFYRTRHVAGLAIHNPDTITHAGDIQSYNGTTATVIGHFEILVNETFFWRRDDPNITLAQGESIRVLLDVGSVSTGVTVTPDFGDDA